MAADRADKTAGKKELKTPPEQASASSKSDSAEKKELKTPWFDGLNNMQKEAVTHGSSPLLILAGAGSGKTRVIISRIAWMVAEKGFRAPSILAVTFTNKAAAEMRERVASMVPDASDVMIRTFHSFGAWLLRRNAAAAGLSPNFTIYDDDDQAALLSGILEGLTKRELKGWAAKISRAKDQALLPEDDLSAITHYPEFPEIYRRYQEKLDSIGNVDFGDLILKPVMLLRSRPEIRNRIRQRFRAVLVDEYQDTNTAQYYLLRELAGPQTWVGVVGDDDQSIYRFRGAEIENILTFPEIFKGTKVVKLEQNYRSTGVILDIASAVVSNNKNRMGKNLWSSGERGEKPVIAYLEDQEEEAKWCAERILEEKNFGGTAVLYRTNAQSRVFEKIFRQYGIPYRIVGTVSFYQREEVKDIIAFLSWMVNPKDEVSFKRIANKPARGLGKASLEKIIFSALKNFSGDLLEACAAAADAGIKGKAAKAAAFLAGIKSAIGLNGASAAHGSSAAIQSDANKSEAIKSEERINSNPEDSAGESKESKDLKERPVENYRHLGAFVQELSEYSGLLEHYREIDRIESSQRVRNIGELISAASEYPATEEGLAAFLELVELDRSMLEEDNNENADMVTLITMHNTKGLEYDYVIITGMEEGLFPRDAGWEENDPETEEERRLFYVAITRARKKLAFTSCRRRMLWGRYNETSPSRFLSEIPSELVRTEGLIDGESPGNSSYSDDPWQPGVKIFHDDYGAGIIQKRLKNSGNTVIHILFESGRSATVLPEFSSHKMEVLGKAGNTEDYF